MSARREVVDTTAAALRKGDQFRDSRSVWTVQQVHERGGKVLVRAGRSGTKPVVFSFASPDAPVQVARKASTAGAYVRQERVARSTGTTVLVVDLAHADSDMEPEVFDPYGMTGTRGENRWATICEDHGIIVTHPTLSLALRHSPDPDVWCDVCRGDEPDPNNPEED